MSTPKPPGGVRTLLGALPESAADIGLADDELQFLLAWAVRAYAVRQEEDAEEGAPELPALSEGSEVSATDVVRTVTALLKAREVAPFELGMWQALGS